MRRIPNLEIGDKLSARSRDKLNAFTTDGDELGWCFDLNDLAHQIAVERSAKSAIRCENQNTASLDLALREKRVLDAFATGSHLRENLGQQRSVWRASQRQLLGALHLRSGDQLHRLGNLASVLHRLDAASNLFSAGHGLD